MRKFDPVCYAGMCRRKEEGGKQQRTSSYANRGQEKGWKKDRRQIAAQLGYPGGEELTVRALVCLLSLCLCLSYTVFHGVQKSTSVKSLFSHAYVPRQGKVAKARLKQQNVEQQRPRHPAGPTPVSPVNPVVNIIYFIQPYLLAYVTSLLVHTYRLYWRIHDNKGPAHLMLDGSNKGPTEYGYLRLIF